MKKQADVYKTMSTPVSIEDIYKLFQKSQEESDRRSAVHKISLARLEKLSNSYSIAKVAQPNRCTVKRL